MPHAPTLSDSELAATCELLFQGQKINAIKQYRASTGTGLKDAKDAIELIEKELRLKSPERFSARASRGGCAVVLVCGATMLASSAWCLSV